MQQYIDYGQIFKEISENAPFLVKLLLRIIQPESITLKQPAQKEMKSSKKYPTTYYQNNVVFALSILMKTRSQRAGGVALNFSLILKANMASRSEWLRNEALFVLNKNCYSREVFILISLSSGM